MELHHKKHHQTYVNALNAAEASYAQSTTPRQRIALQAALKFNGGGKFSYLFRRQTIMSLAFLSYRSSSIVISRYSLHILLGHINHSLFWKNLAPASSEGKGNGGSLKAGPLKDAIDQSFGSLEALKKEFNATTAGIQGSGWGWLVRYFLYQTD
jgi:Fe-Mn family superoxide dismutase